MHIHQLHARQRRGGQHCSRNGVRNVVEFQIQKDVRAKLRNLPHRLRSSSGEELAADLEHAYKIGDLFRRISEPWKGNQNPGLRSGCCVDGRQRSRFGARPECLILAFVALGALRRQLHQFQPHLAHSRVDQANLPGYAIGYINFASFLIGTPVINAHKLKFAVSGVHDPHPGTKGQVRVRGRQSSPR